MTSLLSHPAAQALTWALVHFVWQGAVIAVMAFLVRRFLHLPASARYVTGIVAMAAMLAAPLLTFAYLGSRTPAPVTSAPSAVTSAPPSSAPATPATSRVPSDAAPVTPAPVSGAPTMVLILWLVGVVVLSLRLFGGWVVARRLANRAIRPASPEVQALARRIAGRLAVDRIVGVFESSAVAVPVMIGWMKPVVLLPAAALAGLSPAQLEALIAHEIAHVRRHDYLVNLLQSAVETLLFYHPAVWWVSRRLRVDRELCCDDLALGVCDRVVYASALTDLAAMSATPRLALAATDGPLMRRVRRILGHTVDRAEPGSGWFVGCMVVVVLIAGAMAPAAFSTAKDDGQRVIVATPVEPQTRPVEVAHEVKPEPVRAEPQMVLSADAVRLTGKVEVATAQERPIEVQPEQASAAQVKEQAAKQQAIEAELRSIDSQRLENEFKRAMMKQQAEQRATEQELDLAQKQLVQGRQQFQTGVVNQVTVVELETRVARLQQALMTQRQEMEFLGREMELRRRELSLGRHSEARQDAELKVKQVLDEQSSAKGEAVERLKMEQEMDLVKLRESLRRMEEGFAEKKRLGLDLSDFQQAMAPALAATDTARAGDIVEVSIHNEPDLPRTFVVQADGTIRFPLIGAIKVAGLNTAQTTTAITKQLSDRKLAAGSGVEVVLRRQK